MTVLSVAARRLVGRKSSGSVDDLAAADVWPLLERTTNAQTGTTYTLALTDSQSVVTLSNGSSITLTVPTNASVAFPTGTEIALIQIGAGQVTVAAAGGVTVNGTPGLKISAQHGRVLLVKLGSNTWNIAGNLAS